MTIPSKVAERFMKDTAEHVMMLRADPYYAHCYGGGRVPEPCCKYCSRFDGQYCEIGSEKHDQADICEQYEWSGEWEDD